MTLTPNTLKGIINCDSYPAFMDFNRKIIKTILLRDCKEIFKSFDIQYIKGEDNKTVEKLKLNWVWKNNNFEEEDPKITVIEKEKKGTELLLKEVNKEQEINTYKQEQQALFLEQQFQKYGEKYRDLINQEEITKAFELEDLADTKLAILDLFADIKKVKNNR